MCHIHSESLHDLDHWPQYQNYILTMNVFVCGFSFFTYMEISKLPVHEGLQLQILTYARHSWTLSSEGSLT